jgi:RNase adaptor protein for sRNA GlmZ degradation
MSSLTIGIGCLGLQKTNVRIIEGLLQVTQLKLQIYM